MSEISHHMIPAAPTPVAPFSHAVESDGWIYTSGQIPQSASDPDGSMPGGIVEQTHLCMRNLITVLEGLELTLGNVVSARVYLTHFYEDYDAMNSTYETYFPAGERPARTCIGVTGLARQARVEIDMVARKG